MTTERAIELLETGSKFPNTPHTMAEMDKACNLACLALRRAVKDDKAREEGWLHVYTIKDQLDSTGACPSYATRSATKKDTSKGSCCPMAIGNAIAEMYEEMQEEVADGDAVSPCEKDTLISGTVNSIKCPECGESLRFEGGCNSCPSCGWSKCG